MSNIIWKPLDGSQTLALSCPANVITCHGSRGGGKSDVQLMRYRMRVGQGYGRHWRGVIFDREYKNLDDLVSKSLRWFPQFKDGARFLAGKSDYKWVWPTGEELMFRTLKKEADYWNYHGQEFSFIGINEITKYPNANVIDMITSCNRSSFRPEDHPVYIDGRQHKINPSLPLIYVPESHKYAEERFLPELPLEMFITTNPFGVGFNWVKKRYISIAPAGKVHKTVTNVFNPRTKQRENIVKTQVHLFSSFMENKYLNPEYVATLEAIEDPNKRKAWLGGSWDIVSGGMFDDVWDTNEHIVSASIENIPSSWRIDRSFDWGSSKPFSVGWWAESDGSSLLLDNGEYLPTLKGDLFRIAEWYGCTKKPNEGLMLLDAEIALGIVEREINMRIHGRVHPGPADNSIWNLMNGNSTALEMLKPVIIRGVKYKGVEWARSNKSPGSRVQGWLQIRNLLKASAKQFRKDGSQFIMDEFGKKIRIPREIPGMFFFSNCVDAINLIPTLPRDEKNPDDVDTSSEDHIGDEVRYRCLAVGTGATGGKTKGAL